MDEITTTNIAPERRAELLEIIRDFRLMDDTFMSKVFEDKECAELLLRVILGRDDLTVVRVLSQYEPKNLQGRSARLDIYAVDNKGKQYDIEVQRSDEGGNPKRARYNSSLWTQIRCCPVRIMTTCRKAMLSSSLSMTC